MHWESVDTLLADTLRTLMEAEELKDFRLVGGTALSLHLGHRKSVDIDLFTDAEYGSIDFDQIETYLHHTFNIVQGGFGGGTVMGNSYLVGLNQDDLIKLDIYYSNDPFFQDIVESEAIRMASVEEIIAMKVDVIQRGGRKKDFWDLHEVLSDYIIEDMISLHQQRFEWTHNPELIGSQFTMFEAADEDLDPICLRGKQWAFIKEDFEDALKGPDTGKPKV